MTWGGPLAVVGRPLLSATPRTGGGGGGAELAWGRDKGCPPPCAMSTAEMLPNISCSPRAAPPPPLGRGGSPVAAKCGGLALRARRGTGTASGTGTGTAAPQRDECPAAVARGPLQEPSCRHVALQKRQRLSQHLRPLPEREAHSRQPMVGGTPAGPDPRTTHSPGPALPM